MLDYGFKSFQIILVGDPSDNLTMNINIVRELKLIANLCGKKTSCLSIIDWVTAVVTFHRFSCLKWQNAIKQYSFLNQRHYVDDYGCLSHSDASHIAETLSTVWRFTVKGVCKKSML